MTRPSSRVRKALAALSVVAALIAIYGIRRRFAASDERAALQLLEGYRGGTPPRSIRDVLLTRHPGAVVELRAKEESGCFHMVHVTAEVRDTNGVVASYGFAIDLGDSRIGPADEAGRKVIEEVTSAHP